jgi:hypothetical protein
MYGFLVVEEITQRIAEGSADLNDILYEEIQAGKTDSSRKFRNSAVMQLGKFAEKASPDSREFPGFLGLDKAFFMRETIWRQFGNYLKDLTNNKVSKAKFREKFIDQDGTHIAWCTALGYFSGLVR